MLWILDDGIIIINVKTEGRYAQLNIKFWQKIWDICDILVLFKYTSVEFFLNILLFIYF